MVRTLPVSIRKFRRHRMLLIGLVVVIVLGASVYLLGVKMKWFPGLTSVADTSTGDGNNTVQASADKNPIEETTETITKGFKSLPLAAQVVLGIFIAIVCVIVLINIVFRLGAFITDFFGRLLEKEEQKTAIYNEAKARYDEFVEQRDKLRGEMIKLQAKKQLLDNETQKPLDAIKAINERLKQLSSEIEKKNMVIDSEAATMKHAKKPSPTIE